MNIGTHPEFILKPVLNVKNQFITHCIQIETHTLNHYTNTTRISVFQMTLIIIVISFLLPYLTLSASLFSITIVIDHHHIFARHLDEEGAYFYRLISWSALVSSYICKLLRIK